MHLLPEYYTLLTELLKNRFLLYLIYNAREKSNMRNARQNNKPKEKLDGN